MNSIQPVNLLGKWEGTSRLFHEGDIYDSLSTAEIRTVGQEQFVLITYAWEIEGEVQEGQITFVSKIKEQPTKATWLDSWHIRNSIMICEATENQEGTILLNGSYPAPPGPDWGWRIEVGSDRGDLLLMRMFNISPAGQEELAVQAEYRKTGNLAQSS